MNLKERNQKQREFFNEKIDTYDDVHASFINTKNVLADNLDKNTLRVLDLGVGTGLELIHVYELFPEVEVTAIDISENMLDELRKRSFASHINIICGDLFEVDFGTNYDAVISTSALHHFTIAEKEILYKKIYDSLKENGMFLNCDKISLTEEEQDNQLYELENNFEEHKHIDIPLTINNEIKILKDCNFKDITVDEVDKENYRLIKASKKEGI